MRGTIITGQLTFVFLYGFKIPQISRINESQFMKL